MNKMLVFVIIVGVCSFDRCSLLGFVVPDGSAFMFEFDADAFDILMSMQWCLSLSCG